MYIEERDDNWGSGAGKRLPAIKGDLDYEINQLSSSSSMISKLLLLSA